MLRRFPILRCSAIQSSVVVTSTTIPARPALVDPPGSKQQYDNTLDRKAPWQPPVTIAQHCDFIGLKQPLGEILHGSDIKVAYLLQCRLYHPECGGDPARYQQLAESYAIVSSHYYSNHVSSHGAAPPEAYNPTTTASEMRENVAEAQHITLLKTTLASVWLAISLVLGALVVGWLQLKRQAEANPNAQSHLMADTLLPWWGNDEQYERAVKRLYLEEWRKARGAARRSQNFQAGVSREAIVTEEERIQSDLGIFDVSQEKLKALHERVVKKKQ
eukprot:PhF_6_TR3300/c0_g1_i2/m.4646